MAPATRTTTPETGLPILEIKRVQLPDYLDTTDILERNGNQLLPSRTGRWGERLSVGMSRALAASLSDRLPHMSVRTTLSSQNVARRLLIDVTSFDWRQSREVVLAVQWSIEDPARHELVAEHALLVETVGEGGDAAVVAAMSKTVEDLADRLAVAIQARG